MKTKLILCLLFLTLFLYAGSASAGSEYYGDANVFYGNGAGNSLPYGNAADNTFIGIAAGAANSTGNRNTFIGHTAGPQNNGDNNTFVGFQTGYENWSGSSNTFMGREAGYFNETGHSNTFIGRSAGYDGTGNRNTFVGRNAGFGNSGDNNTFVGYGAGSGQYAGNHNTIVGYESGKNNNGTGNTFIGDNAGYTNDTGNNNTFIGRHAGESNLTGSGNVFIGYYAGSNIFHEKKDNHLIIANSNTDSPLIYGRFDQAWAYINGDLSVQGNTYAESDIRLKEDIRPITSSLDKILNIQGVSYTWKKDRAKKKATNVRRHYGVVAQQVEKVLPEIVKEGENKKKKVAYTEIIPVLIEAMKEQQKTIIELRNKIQLLEHHVKLKDSLAMAEVN